MCSSGVDVLHQRTDLGTSVGELSVNVILSHFVSYR